MPMTLRRPVQRIALLVLTPALIVFITIFTTGGSYGADPAVGRGRPECCPAPRAGETFTNSLGMTFVYIDPGNFIMGSPLQETGRDEDETAHLVILSEGFYLQTTEVTQAQWRAVMGDNPSGFPECGGDCPVERVSLDMVRIFIGRLNKLSDGVNYRLPTEAEWEYACRAGSRSAFANGNITELDCGHDPRLDKMGWYCGNAGGTPHAVAQKTPNVWGLYDMHGNVFEWTADWYWDYSFCPVIDPAGPDLGHGAVIRGGCWKSYARFCRSADRGRYPPDFRNRYTGFRLAVSR